MLLNLKMGKGAHKPRNAVASKSWQGPGNGFSLEGSRRNAAWLTYDFSTVNAILYL